VEKVSTALGLKGFGEATPRGAPPGAWTSTSIDPVGETSDPSIITVTVLCPLGNPASNGGDHPWRQVPILNRCGVVGRTAVLPGIAAIWLPA
jgi:hypothetical protein